MAWRHTGIVLVVQATDSLNVNYFIVAEAHIYQNLVRMSYQDQIALKLPHSYLHIVLHPFLSQLTLVWNQYLFLYKNQNTLNKETYIAAHYRRSQQHNEKNLVQIVAANVKNTCHISMHQPTSQRSLSHKVCLNQKVWPSPRFPFS